MVKIPYPPYRGPGNKDGAVEHAETVLKEPSGSLIHLWDLKSKTDFASLNLQGNNRLVVEAICNRRSPNRNQIVFWIMVTSSLQVPCASSGTFAIKPSFSKFEGRVAPSSELHRTSTSAGQANKTKTKKTRQEILLNPAITRRCILGTRSGEGKEPREKRCPRQWE